jgi:hypothetical protein
VQQSCHRGAMRRKRRLHHGESFHSESFTLGEQLCAGSSGYEHASAFHIQKRRTRRFVQVATAIALYQSVRPAVTVMVVTFSVAAGADADCRTRYSLATLNNVSILCPFSPEAMVIASIAHEPR